MTLLSSNGAGIGIPFGRTSKATRIGLFLQCGLAFDEWKQIGCHVQLVQDSSAWWIGDWLVYGQNEYGRRYRDAIEATGFDYQTLRNCAWVASRFEPSRRREGLSFAHHAEVASLPDVDQDMWLDRALLNGWSRNELRRQLREFCASRSKERVTVALAVTADRHERWCAAASAERRDLREWMREILDSAADDALRTEVTDSANAGVRPRLRSAGLAAAERDAA